MAPTSRFGRPLRLALIGAGAWGERAHLAALEDFDDADVVALVDADALHAGEVASRRGIRRVFGDPDALFNAFPDLDAVIIATPTDTHAAIVRRALAAGVAILCEKPLAYDLAQARAMAEGAGERGAVTKVGFLFRFSPVMARMRQLVDEGFVGQVQLFESININAQFMSPERPRHWKMERARANGGVFVEYGAHSIDLALWLGGQLTSVVAHGVTLVPERRVDTGERGTVDSDDASSWIATYAEGGEALFRTGWASLPVGGVGLRVYGSRGSLGWQLDPTGRRRESLVAATLEDPEPRVIFDFEPAFDPRSDGGDFPLGLLARYNARLVRSFLDDVRAGRSSGPDFGDGLAAQRVLEAVRRSLDQRRWVEIPG